MGNEWNMDKCKKSIEKFPTISEVNRERLSRTCVLRFKMKHIYIVMFPTINSGQQISSHILWVFRVKTALIKDTWWIREYSSTRKRAWGPNMSGWLWSMVRQGEIRTPVSWAYQEDCYWLRGGIISSRRIKDHQCDQFHFISRTCLTYFGIPRVIMMPTLSSLKTFAYQCMYVYFYILLAFGGLLSPNSHLL